MSGKIKSAVATQKGCDFFGFLGNRWTKNGVSLSGEQQWTRGRGDYCGESLLETLAAAGLVEIEREEEKPRFRKGDWIVRKDGTAFYGDTYRRKWDDAFACQSLVDFAPPEPPADVLAAHCPPLKVTDYRPVSTGDSYFWSSGNNVTAISDTGLSWNVGPRYILAPVDRPEWHETDGGSEHFGFVHAENGKKVIRPYPPVERPEKREDDVPHKCETCGYYDEPDELRHATPMGYPCKHCTGSLTDYWKPSDRKEARG